MKKRLVCQFFSLDYDRRVRLSRGSVYGMEVEI